MSDQRTPIPTYTPKRVRAGLAAAVLASAFLTTSLFAQTIWTGGGADDLWNNAGNWDNGIPVASGNTFISNGTVTLNGSGNARILYMGNVEDAIVSFTINDGADLTVGGAGTSALTSATGAETTVTQNGGSVSFGNSLGFGSTGGSSNGGNSTYIMNGGTLSVGRSATPTSGLKLGYSTGDSTDSNFIQNDGDVSLVSLSIGESKHGGFGNSNTSLYEIHSGSLTVANDWTQATSSTQGGSTASGTATIVGSNATINVNGNMILNQNEDNSSTLSYTVDNGGVSTINLASGSTASLAGTLEASLKGGMTLTAEDSFTLVQGDAGSITDGFETKPDAVLWEAGVNGDSSAMVLSLNNAALQGTVAMGDSVSFAGTGQGYITITGLTSGQQIAIYIDFDPGVGETVESYITYLGENGIVASEVSEGDYSVMVSMAAQSEEANFAWDVTDYNIDATISGVSVVVPEPATTAAIGAVLALLVTAFIRRRKS